MLDEDIKKLYDEGYSSHFIGRVYHVSHQTILNRLEEIGVKRRTKSEALNKHHEINGTKNTNPYGVRLARCCRSCGYYEASISNKHCDRNGIEVDDVLLCKNYKEGNRGTFFGKAVGHDD